MPPKKTKSAGKASKNYLKGAAKVNAAKDHGDKSGEIKGDGAKVDATKNDSTKSDDTTPACDKFTLFPKLAGELRLKIWKEACSVARNVDVFVDIYKHGGTNKTKKAKGKEFMTYRLRSYSGSPGVLGANKESRLEALKHYTLAFGVTEKGPRGGDITSPPTIYINLKLDRPCFMNFAEFGRLDNRYRCENIFDQCGKLGLTSIAYNVHEDMQERRGEWFQPGEYYAEHFHHSQNQEEVILFDCAMPQPG